jgi:hypothetical protein
VPRMACMLLTKRVTAAPVADAASLDVVC